jgi:hypothetical protein
MKNLLGLGSHSSCGIYQNLLEQKETKGHCFNVPKTLPLGRWLRRQRWWNLESCLLLDLMIKQV